MGGLALLYFFVFILSIFNWGWLYSDSFRTVGLVVTVIAIVLAALSLVLDFGTIEAGVQAGAPKELEWYLGFGLMVTLVWLYISILKLLALLSMGALMMRHRLLVLGGGPAGMTAALQARELGAEVTLVEARRPGGTSLNEGPAPVRTLARAARLMRDARTWDQFGLRGALPQLDLAAALANARPGRRLRPRAAATGRIRPRPTGSSWSRGPARRCSAIRTPCRSADGRTFAGDAVIIAVGGHAGRLPIPGAELGLTYDGVRAA